MKQRNVSMAVSNNEILAFLRRFGRNTNSFLLAYGGCEWFRSDTPPGLVAYVRSGRTCVIAGDPLCAPEDTVAVLQTFSQHMGSHYRIMLTLVSGWLVTQLRQAGYGAIKIGSDPFFDLGNWRPRGNLAKKVRSAVNLARRTGVTVSAYRPAERRDLRLEQEIQDCAKAWLATRRGFTIRLFSVIRPLECAEKKRHFVAWHGGRLVGFVTCSPIYARNGWFIEDIVRRPEAPYGTTELLITTALQSLREDGFSVATLGVAPFVDLETDFEHPGRTRLQRVILIALRPFYNFRGYIHYRKKFAPSWWEPVYLAFWPDRITCGLALNVINALFPQGFLGVVRGWVASCTRGLIAQPIAAFRRLFLFSRVALYIPLKKKHRFLDFLALSIGLAVAFVVASTIYQALVGPNDVLITVSKFHEKWVERLILPAVPPFLAWRLLAMLARVWQGRPIGNELGRDKPA